MSGDPVRRAALDVLVDVGSGAGLSARLDAALAGCRDARDAAFLAELVKGTVRFQGRYDQLVRRLSRRGRLPADRAVLALLRLGLHQLIDCAGVPAYAAVDTTVTLCRQRLAARQAPFVNAVLQNVARRLASGAGPAAAEAARAATAGSGVGAPASRMAAAGEAAAGEAAAGAEAALADLFPPRDREPAAYLAAWHSHPRWLVERWLARWGYERTEALCRHNNRPAPVTLHVLAPHAPAAAAARLAAAGWETAPGRLHPRALVLRGRPAQQELRALLAAEPALLVQDEAAQAACAWLAAGGPGGAGGSGAGWADLCAAPGGKTFHLRALWGGAAPVVAMDRSAARLARLVENGKRIEGGAPLVVRADAGAPPLRAGRWDAAVLDGPCSGTGVMRHHPEGRWRLQPSWLAASGARLRELAATAARLLRPGGRLLYVTCSLEPEENEDVVAAVVAAGLCAPDPHPEGGAEGGWQRAWLPPLTESDGFFAARLRRREDTA